MPYKSRVEWSVSPSLPALGARGPASLKTPSISAGPPLLRLKTAASPGTRLADYLFGSCLPHWPQIALTLAAAFVG